MKFLTGEEEKEATNWIAEAAKVAEKALCLKAKCGTVIVKNGEIIGTGYNAPPLDREENRTCLDELAPGKPKYDQTCCMHAEWRAILDALEHNNHKIAGSTLYFTRVNDLGETKRSGRPYCSVCSRFALDTGITEFVLWQEQGICSYKTDEYNKLSYNYHPEV